MRLIPFVLCVCALALVACSSAPEVEVAGAGNSHQLACRAADAEHSDAECDAACNTEPYECPESACACVDCSEETEGEAEGDEHGHVEVCHIPPGHPEHAHTIMVGEAAVDAHLAHGDTLGACDEAAAGHMGEGGCEGCMHGGEHSCEHAEQGEAEAEEGGEEEMSEGMGHGGMCGMQGGDEDEEAEDVDAEAEAEGEAEETETGSCGGCSGSNGMGGMGGMGGHGCGGDADPDEEPDQPDPA